MNALPLKPILTLAAVVAGSLAATSGAATLVDPGFPVGSITSGDNTLNPNNAGDGWLAGGNANNPLFESVGVTIDGDAEDVGSFVRRDALGFRYLQQLVTDGGTTAGLNTFTYAVFSNDVDVEPGQTRDQNNFFVQVLGTNASSFALPSSGNLDAFTLLFDSRDSSATNAPVSGALDYAESFAADVDFGAGYEYLAVRIAAQFQSNGGPAPAGDYLYVDDVDIVPIPEPTTALAGGVALGLLAGRRRR